MLILLDQDNVLADFESGFRRHWRNRFGEDAPIEGKEHLFYIRDRLPEHLQRDAGMVTTLGLFYLQQVPLSDYVWAKEENDGIIQNVTNFLKRYLSP